MPAPVPLETRVRIASALVEGNSLRATTRMVEVARGTVLDFALRLGEGCIRLHNRKVRSLAAHVIQVDEQWSFVQKKQARVSGDDPAEHGDAYTYVALEANTKLVIACHVGKRDAANKRRSSPISARGSRSCRTSRATDGSRTSKRSGRTSPAQSITASA